jgi:hypothetical protein
MYFSFGKKLVCSFVDFKSAFDTVWRLGLWQKLQKSNIQGKIFKVIYNMYQNIKTCIRKGEEWSVFFNSEVGVKQRENMSPFLFSLFLNDLETFFLENNISFFPKEKYIAIRECKTKILSTVENPLLNPVCAPEISSTSSANLFNLLFRTAVNVLLKQELSVIPL